MKSQSSSFVNCQEKSDLTLHILASLGSLDAIELSLPLDFAIALFGPFTLH